MSSFYAAVHVLLRAPHLLAASQGTLIKIFFKYLIALFSKAPSWMGGAALSHFQGPHSNFCLGCEWHQSAGVHTSTGNKNPKTSLECWLKSLFTFPLCWESNHREDKLSTFSFSNLSTRYEKAKEQSPEVVPPKFQLIYLCKHYIVSRNK